MIAAAAAPRIDPAILEPALVQLTRHEARASAGSASPRSSPARA